MRLWNLKAFLEYAAGVLMRHLHPADTLSTTRILPQPNPLAASWTHLSRCHDLERLVSQILLLIFSAHLLCLIVAAGTRGHM